MAFGRAIDPRNGNPLAQAVVLSGGVIPPNTQANVVAGLTVKAPGAAGRYDGACFMVQRASGTGVITIDGDGINLDGSATAILGSDENLRFYVYDATAGQWTRGAVPRSAPGFGEPIYLASELPATAPSWSFAAGSTFGLIWSPVTNALLMPQSNGFNETYGYYFSNFVTMRCLGVRISSGPLGNGKGFTVKLYSTTDTTNPIATAVQTSVANNEDMRILFSSPQTLVKPGGAAGTGQRFVVTMFCTTGGPYVPFSNETINNGTLNVGSVPNPATWPLYVAPRLMFHSFAWVGGNAFPSSMISNVSPAIEPILEYV